MAGQSVDGHHPDPVVDRVWRAVQWRSFNEPLAERADVTQCPRAVESEEVGLIDLALIPFDLVQPAGNFGDRWWC